MDKYFPRIELPITIDQFHTLPQNSAYKYEYFDDRAVLSPRPKTFNAILTMRKIPLNSDLRIEPLPRTEISTLKNLFVSAFSRVQPIASLSKTKASKAAREWLLEITEDKHGPLIEKACFLAYRDIHPMYKGPIGAILIVLRPKAILTDPFDGEWEEPPPADAIINRLGVPHITWIFVASLENRRGVGTALLASSVRVLREMGYTQLASTFLQGNDSSMLWHWKNGFKLVPWSNFRIARESKSK